MDYQDQKRRSLCLSEMYWFRNRLYGFPDVDDDLFMNFSHFFPARPGFFIAGTDSVGYNSDRWKGFPSWIRLKKILNQRFLIGIV